MYDIFCKCLFFVKHLDFPKKLNIDLRSRNLAESSPTVWASAHVCWWLSPSLPLPVFWGFGVVRSQDIRGAGSRCGVFSPANGRAHAGEVGACGIVSLYKKIKILYHQDEDTWRGHGPAGRHGSGAVPPGRGWAVSPGLLSSNLYVGVSSKYSKKNPWRLKWQRVQCERQLNLGQSWQLLSGPV